MPPVGFEPKISGGERPKTYALDCAATATVREDTPYCIILMYTINSNSLPQADVPLQLTKFTILCLSLWHYSLFVASLRNEIFHSFCPLCFILYMVYGHCSPLTVFHSIVCKFLKTSAFLSVLCGIISSCLQVIKLSNFTITICIQWYFVTTRWKYITLVVLCHVFYRPMTYGKILRCS